MAITAIPTSVTPNFHASLYDGTTTIGLIFVDSEGNQNERAFTATPYPRTALKTRTGENKYDDLEGPYFAIAQDDFSGGRANEEFERDTSRFFDSWHIDTLREGSVILGGMVTYATGYRSGNQYMPTTSTNYYWRTLEEDDRWIAASFTTDSSGYSADKAEFYIRRIGSPGSIYGRLYDNDGEPNAQLISATVTEEAFGSDKPSIFYKFNWTGTQALSASTTYWIVLVAAAGGDANNHWEVLCHDNTSTSAARKTSPDGSTWTDTQYFPYYRVTDTNDDFVAHFFEYKNQLYFATQPDDGGAGKVYINGWRGACDSNTSDLTKLNDATQSWTTDALIGNVAKMIGNNADGELQNWRLITDNDATSVTSTAWTAEQNTAFDYVILGSNEFTELTGTGLTKPVHDVLPVKDFVHFLQGISAQDQQLLSQNDAGTWENNWKSFGIKGNFAIKQISPIKGDLIWSAFNNLVKDYEAEVYRDIAPESFWDQYWSYIILEDLTDAWNEQAVTNVVSAHIGGDTIHIQASNGVVATVSINAAGVDYAVNDKIYIVQSGSSGDARVNVAGVGATGNVTSISAIVFGGSNYSTGTGLATITDGSGTGFTIDIDTITSFGTGIMASELISSTDLRDTNKILLRIYTDTAMNAGDLQLLLDNTANCASPVLTLDLPSLKKKRWDYVEIDYDSTDVAGIDDIVSIGIQLANDRSLYDNTGLITIEITGSVTAIVDQSPIDIGSDHGRITNLLLYGDPEVPWVLTEKTIGPIENDLFYPIPLKEISTVASPNNGRAACVGDVYLYFSLGEGLERYYSQNLDDIGPDRDAGLPANRQGPISALASYPGRIYAAIDCSTTGSYSSILCLSGNGWHEIFRAPQPDRRIRSLYIQSLPNIDVQKLWFSMDSDVCWIPITKNPYYRSDYNYTHEGYLTTSWIYAGMQDIYKTWKSLKIFAEDITSGVEIIADYQCDNDSTWTEIGTFDTEPVEEINISSSLTNVDNKRRIRFMLRFYTNDPQSTPRMKAIVTEGVAFVPVKNQYSFAFILTEGDKDIDLLGDDDSTFATVQAKTTQLATWANTGTALTFRCNYSPADNKTVFIDPISFQPITNVADQQIEEHIAQMTVIEI